jgi:predicted nucleotidyltransferase
VRVSKDDTICGLAAPAARQLMRAYCDDRPVEVACDILGVSQDAARDQMRAFEAAGYVERGGLAHGAGDGWWATTVKGNALANASFGKPISRATATRLLGEVIERARAYNADPARLLTVTEIVVFGSYLDPAVGLLGDLDLAVSTVRRDTGGQRYVDKVLEYAANLRNGSRSSMSSPTIPRRSLHPRTRRRRSTVLAVGQLRRSAGLCAFSLTSRMTQRDGTTGRDAPGSRTSCTPGDPAPHGPTPPRRSRASGRLPGSRPTR